MVLLVVVNVINVAYFIAMAKVEMSVLRSKGLDRQLRFQLVMRDLRRCSLCVLMTERFIRYRLWAIFETTSPYEPVPFWPLSWYELVLVSVFFAAMVASMVAPDIIERRYGVKRLPEGRLFGLVSTLDPAFMVFVPFLKRIENKGLQRAATAGSASLVGMSFAMGLFYIALTLIVAAKNVM